ncbi:hypothetical protein M5D96_010551 [Drosophila gunungcola]|uniref:Uncharacterized protein n=1 Tax=Drosophila gunungcola TaxID=103775 RepID=A0A9P9YHB6_9MUSC|nr:hypothetical protein M5D96_010551 [Drosophila gunungcola]
MNSKSFINECESTPKASTQNETDVSLTINNQKESETTPKKSEVPSYNNPHHRKATFVRLKSKQRKELKHALSRGIPKEYALAWIQNVSKVQRSQEPKRDNQESAKIIQDSTKTSLS